MIIIFVWILMYKDKYLYLQPTSGADRFWQRVELNSKHVERWNTARKYHVSNFLHGEENYALAA